MVHPLHQVHALAHEDTVTSLSSFKCNVINLGLLQTSSESSPSFSQAETVQSPFQVRLRTTEQEQGAGKSDKMVLCTSPGHSLNL